MPFFSTFLWLPENVPCLIYLCRIQAVLRRLRRFCLSLCQSSMTIRKTPAIPFRQSRDNVFFSAYTLSLRITYISVEVISTKYRNITTWQALKKRGSNFHAFFWLPERARYEKIRYLFQIYPERLSSGADFCKMSEECSGCVKITYKLAEIRYLFEPKMRRQIRIKIRYP